LSFSLVVEEARIALAVGGRRLISISDGIWSSARLTPPGDPRNP